MSKNSTPVPNEFEAFVPDESPDGDTELPTVGLADICGRPLRLYGVKWQGETAYKNEAGRETWLLEFSETGDSEPTFLTFTNHTALLNQLKGMEGRYRRTVQIAAPDTARRYYRFVKPTA